MAGIAPHPVIPVTAIHVIFSMKIGGKLPFRRIALEFIVTSASNDYVISRMPPDEVVSLTSLKVIVTPMTKDVISTGPPVYRVVAACGAVFYPRNVMAEKGVLIGIGEATYFNRPIVESHQDLAVTGEVIVAPSPDDQVVADSTKEGIPPIRSIDEVISDVAIPHFSSFIDTGGTLSGVNESPHLFLAVRIKPVVALCT
jgi:hypothetical protein